MKRSFLTAAVLLLTVSGYAVAQSESVIFFDVRNNTTDLDASGGMPQNLAAPVIPYTQGQETGQTAPNGGGAGDGQVLRITPTHADNFNLAPKADLTDVRQGGSDSFDYDHDKNTATGKLNLFMLVNDDLTGGAGDVIDAIGLDFLRTSPVTPYNTFTYTFAWNPVYFDGVNNGSASGGNWTGAKAVQVPVTTGPAYDTTNALVPSLTPYRIGSISAVGGTRACGPFVGPDNYNNSLYVMNMTRNNLLICRAFSTGGDANEQVSLGYAVGLGGGIAGPDAPFNGSDPNAAVANANPDGAILVSIKSDTSGNGAAQLNDLAGFTAALTAANHRQYNAFLHDYSGNQRVQLNDLAGFNASVIASSTSSCP